MFNVVPLSYSGERPPRLLKVRAQTAKGFVVAFLFCFTYSVHSQSFEMRLNHYGGGVIAVQMRETSGNPPTTSDYILDLVYGICWPTSYGIDLGAITTSYTIHKVGTETVDTETEFQLFAMDSDPVQVPVGWVTNE